jgi:neutral ceramidase
MTWRVGTAAELITPDEPLWLAGYLVRKEPARGTISDLFASALAIEDERGGRLVIMSVDLIAITKTIAEPVYAAVQRQLGLPRERLVLAATHTHYGPEFRPDKVPLFLIPPEHAAKVPETGRWIVDAIVGVIVTAVNDLEPVRLFAGRTTASFAHNRRRLGVKNGRPSTEDVLDQDVPVLWATRPDGSRKAIVFGYACHNTTIPPEDGRYCADWAGFAKEQLSRENGGATALFITGCGADQNPEPRGSIELSKQYGREIADAVQRVMTNDAIELTGPIRTAMEHVPLALKPMPREKIDTMLAAADDPPKQVKARFLLDQINRGEPLITSYAGAFQAIGIGDQLLMIAMSGEPVVDWSHKFKREFAGVVAPFVWVAGYCNDMYGYIPTHRIQEEGGYEGGRANLWSWVPAPFTDDLEDRVTNGVRRLVARVSNTP